MERGNHTTDILLKRLMKDIDDNLVNDQFGVEDLSRNMGMSRSQLHRKLTLATGKSVSQFIREYRLEKGMELMKVGSLTAAEVSELIGFGSPTYFNKCFTDYYGFPPGEVKNRLAELNEEPVPVGIDTPARSPRIKLFFIAAGVLALSIIAVVYFAFPKKSNAVNNDGRSIAILPFKNLSGDHHNEYFIEGVIEAIRTNLAQSTDLRVISRTSVEKYSAEREQRPYRCQADRRRYSGTSMGAKLRS